MAEFATKQKVFLENVFKQGKVIRKKCFVYFSYEIFLVLSSIIFDKSHFSYTEW